MTLRFDFEVPGKPVAWARPRKSKHGGYYTAPAAAAQKEAIQWAAKSLGIRPLLGPVTLTVKAFWEWPQSKWRVIKPLVGAPRTSRPDADNVLKLVMDALEGIAYHDDAQVVCATCVKMFTEQGYPAGTLVQVAPVEPTTRVLPLEAPE